MRVHLSLVGFVTVVSLFGVLNGASAGDAPSANQHHLRVYIDPATGRPGEPPAAERNRALQPAADSALSTSNDGLTVRQGTTAAGGVILDLGGRFQDDVTVTHDAGGNKVTCTQAGRTGTSP